MQLNKKNYILILKWRRAEHWALKHLGENDRKYITPLIELVLPTVPSHKDKAGEIKKTPEEMLSEMVSKFKDQKIEKIPQEILHSWGKSPIYIDFSLLHDGSLTVDLKIESARKIFPAGNLLGLKLIPVLNLNDDKKIQEAFYVLAKEYGNNLCLRVTPSDLEDIEELDKKLEKFLTDSSLEEKNIDLLVDIKEITGEAQYTKFAALSQKIKTLKNWRNFIFSSGAFPVNLNDCNFTEPTPLPRLDWKGWKEQIENKATKRKPIYADYAIRNPVFNESLQFHHPTTSIKYTTEDEWFVMKGKQKRYEFYLANAKLLVEESKKFYGKDFSAGDQFIFEKAAYYEEYAKKKLKGGTGTNENWIAAGINHHAVVVVRQLANLS